MTIKKRISITSPHNEQVKRWKKLNTRKGRAQERALLIEGEHLLLEAARASAQFEAVLVNRDKEEIYQRIKGELPTDAPVYELASAVFATLVDTETPQGLAAVITAPVWPRDVWLDKEGDLTVLLLDAVQDPGNLGTIIRTAQAAGVDSILLGKGTVDPFNAKVVRSAMGALFRMPLIQIDLAEAIPMLQSRGVTVVNASPHAGTHHFEYAFPARVALLLGNEGRGVDEKYLPLVDADVTIPMPGGTESLNVSITGAILLYERIRQHFQAR
jgi:TrmH family RNA methyltransferase